MRLPHLFLLTAAAGLASSAEVGAQLADLQPGRNFPTAAIAFGGGRSENIDVGDVDNDGDYDVGVANGGDGSAQANSLFINNGGLQGGAAGTFSDGTAARFAGVPDDTSRDIEFADIDDDCDLDVYISNRGTTVNGGEVSRVYVNQGAAQGGTVGFFSEGTDSFWRQLVSVPAGDQVFGGDVGPWRDFSCDCDFGDLDLDGDVDLFHSSYGPNINGTRDSRIFLNDGTGTFDEMWPWINGTADIQVHTLDIDLVDLDDDFDLDVFASSRDSQARVYRNNYQLATGAWPATAFSDITQSALINSGATFAGGANYECEYGDMDGDGDFDIYGKNYDPGLQDVMLSNNGDMTFTKVDVLNGDPAQDENEADFLDFDNDGDLDVFLANFSGTNWIHASGLAQGLSGTNLYHRTGQGLYPADETPSSSNSGTTLDGECADMDGDGDTDILLANDGNQQNRYWENVLGVPDTHAPTVYQMTVQGDKADGSDTFIRVQLRDNANFYVIAYYDVDLMYTVDGGVENRVRMFSQGSQQFQAVIPGGIDGTISYRVTGSDEAGNSFSSGSVSYVQSSSGLATLQNVDDGTPGTRGNPYLQLAGDFIGPSVVTTNLCDANANSLAVLFASLSSVPTLFKGGILYTVPVALEVSLNTGANGQVWFPAVWPAGIPATTNVWFQFGVADPAATGGAALSNAVKLTTP